MPPPEATEKYFLPFPGPTSCRCLQPGAGNGSVGGVTGDGNFNTLSLHDSNAFQNVVSAVALNSSALAVRVRDGLNNLQFAGLEVVIGLDIGETVDTADDLAASLPRPFRITRRGSLRTLLAVRAMPIAPSAAAKDSWPARKAKQWVSSCSSMAPRLPWPRPTLRCSATEPGW